MLERTSIDSESTWAGNWVTATTVSSRGITREAKEPRVLCFYPHAQYEVTFNKDGKYSQGQLAILAKMPTSSTLEDFAPLEILVAPEGCKSIPSQIAGDMDGLKDKGWHLETITTAPERAHSLRFGLQGKRRQYGLRHRIASTIHAGMGQDLDAIVTKVTPRGQAGSRQYELWEREQVVVLTSRTHFARDMYFVGTPSGTSQALSELLRVRTQYSEYLEHLLRNLCSPETENGDSPNLPGLFIDQTAGHGHPFRSVDIELPQDATGYVYMLVSLNDRVSTYIGQTANLVRRLHAHNSGYGSSSTAHIDLRPWALMGYVTGFGSATAQQRMSFEGMWKVGRDNEAARAQRPLSVDEIALIGARLTKTWKRRTEEELELRFVKCGSFASSQG